MAAIKKDATYVQKFQDLTVDLTDEPKATLRSKVDDGTISDLAIEREFAALYAECPEVLKGYARSLLN
jgi:hypothetical protein